MAKKTKRIEADSRFILDLDGIRGCLRKNGYNGSYREATALLHYVVNSMNKDMDREVKALRRMMDF